MPSFGSFETVREIYSDPIYTVYVAKKSGDATSEYAVKVFSIQRVPMDEESTSHLESLLGDIERTRLAGIEIQAKGAATSQYIAPVIESGYDNRGVWYATHFYPRSVNKIISGRVALTREAFHHIISSIAHGALDFKKACGRSHGDIRPSNVQISKSERLTKANVVLSDPLPGSEAEGARYELSDLRAVGQVMLQLVLQRAIEREEDFLILPILASPEWTRLFGKETERWLAICNRLLDPDLGQKQHSLEELVAELDRLEPKSGVPPKTIAMAAAAAIVLLGAVIFILRPRSQTVEVSSDPPGATIVLDKAEQPQKAPLTLKLKKGNYTLEAKHDALQLPAQATNWVVSGGGVAQLKFQFPYGSVLIKSEPPGATITADGKQVGKTPADGSPFVIPVLPGGTEVKYELSLAEHVSKTVRGTVTNGQKLALTETLPASKDVGTLDMDSVPRGAKVFWKDKLLTEATPQPAEVEQGSYVLTAVYRDWPPKQMTVEVKRKETTSVNFYFENGKVSLDSDPPGATVWFGTNLLGETPKVSPPLPAGTNTLRFERAGYETTNVVVLVRDKSTTPLRPVLITTNGVFEFSSDPATAIILDQTGKELGRTGPGKPFNYAVAPGTYSFGARVEGLNELQPLPLTVAKREVKRHTFVFEYATVLLDSAPSGASISADGRNLGVTPATFIQKPGTRVNYRVVAPDYLPATNEVVLQNGERDKSVIARLLPEPVSVALKSDPPGAQYFVGSSAINGSDTSFSLPWGTNEVTAKYALFPNLGEVTQTLVIKKGAANNYDFKFNYGTVILTNVPDYIKIKEGGKELGAVNGAIRIAYDRPGSHTYEFFDDNTKQETIVTNVALGAFTILTPQELGEIKNGIGMKLVKVRDLFGPGKDCWVGKYEVSQGEYQLVMGGNPSTNAVGTNFPVQNVSWEKAQEFCTKLRGADPKMRIRGDYRLPTKEEWLKFAAGTPFAGAAIRSKAPMPVNFGNPNPQRLYNVLGNVWEWLADTDGTNASYIGYGFSGGFNLVFGTTETRSRTWSDNQVGFRVIMVPTDATSAAK